MHTVCIVQQRLGSTRYPSKALANIQGKPLTWHVLRRIQGTEGIDALVLAVPDEGSRTQRLVEIGDSLCVPVEVVPGDPSDLLHRHTQVALKYHAARIIRIPGDNPCADPTEIERIIRHADARIGSWQWLITNLDRNVLGNGYPAGLGAEVYDIRFLAWLDRNISEPRHREHPHKWAFDNHRVETIECPDAIRRPTLDLSVNTPEDLAFIRSIYEALPSNFNARQVIQLLDKRQVDSLDPPK